MARQLAVCHVAAGCQDDPGHPLRPPSSDPEVVVHTSAPSSFVAPPGDPHERAAPCAAPGGYDEATIPLVASGPDLVALPVGPPRDELLLLLPGSGMGPGAHQHVLRTAAWAGYTAIGLEYEYLPVMGQFCPAFYAPEDWLDCSEGGSLAKVYGPEYSAFVQVLDVDSIVGRLHARLAALDAEDPSAGWDRWYLPAEGVHDHEEYLVWDRIVLAGFSQGVTHAAMLAHHHAVRGLVALSGPPVEPALISWVGPGATPGGARLGFLHAEEAYAGIVTANLDTMEIPGEDVTIVLPDGPAWERWPPFDGARRLVAALEPADCGGEDLAHASMAKDDCMNVDDAAEGDAYALFRPYLYALCEVGATPARGRPVR